VPPVWKGQAPGGPPALLNRTYLLPGFRLSLQSDFNMVISNRPTQLLSGAIVLDLDVLAREAQPAVPASTATRHMVRCGRAASRPPSLARPFANRKREFRLSVQTLACRIAPALPLWQGGCSRPSPCGAPFGLSVRASSCLPPSVTTRAPVAPPRALDFFLAPD